MRVRESECPVNVRSHSGQPCALCMTGDFCVLATARHTRVCLRVAVLHKSPRPASVCSAAAPTVTAFVTLVEFGAVARDTARARFSSASLPFVVGLLPRLPLAIRVAMPRRRDTAFSPRLRLAALSANRSPPSRSAPPRHPSRASPRSGAFSFAPSAAALSAPPWFDPNLLGFVARSRLCAGEDMWYVCYGLSREALWQGLMNERSDDVGFGSREARARGEHGQKRCFEAERKSERRRQATPPRRESRGRRRRQSGRE